MTTTRTFLPRLNLPRLPPSRRRPQRYPPTGRDAPTSTPRRLAAERQVAAMFLGSALMTVLFVVAFVAIPVDETVYIWGFGTVNASNIALGVTFGLAILLIGTGAIHWSKKLMNEKGRDPAAPPAGLQ